MYCKNCGRKVDENAGVCTKCGAAQDIVLKNSGKKPLHKRWWFWLLIMAIFFGGNKPTEENALGTDPQSSIETAVTEITQPETIATETPETIATELVATVPAKTEAPTNPPEAVYVLNTNSMKFHYSHCGSADDIKDSNKSTFTGTREQILAKGYSPCGRCDP